MSPAWKTQLLRIARLFAFALIGVLIPFVSGLHGAPTLTAIEAVIIVAGEAGFRAIFPTVEGWLAIPPPIPPAMADSALKEAYAPQIQAQLDSVSPFFTMLRPKPLVLPAVPVATAEPFDHENPVHNPPEPVTGAATAAEPPAAPISPAVF